MTTDEEFEKAHRDKLAEKWQSTFGEGAFIAGYDAGERSPRVRELVEALECYVENESYENFDALLLALKRYRGEK